MMFNVQHRTAALIASVIVALLMTWMIRTPAHGRAFVQDESSAEDGIRASAEAFVEAFNRGDAAAVGALWSENAEYIDETGRHTHGRDAIQKEYADLFAQNPGVKIKVEIDSIKMVGEYTAIEDGRTTVTVDPEATPVTAIYKSVHVKKNGQWEMASVHDYPVAEDVRSSHVEDLDWLVGEWISRHDGVELKVSCKWIVEKQFVERSWEAVSDGSVVLSGRQIIGWDPLADQMTSWSFTSDGGHAVGVWTPKAGGWLIHSAGVLSDGTETSSAETMSVGGSDKLSWSSADRFVGGVQIPDTSEVVLERTQ